MWTDQVVEETRRIREAFAAQYDYDVEAIYQVLKQQEQHNERIVVSLPPKQPAPPALPRDEAAA